MLCTLVFAIGTFPYALRAVAIPWSLDQDRLWALFWGGSMVANVSDWERCKKFIAHVFLVFFSADEEKKHVYALEYFVDVWFFSLLRFGASLMCNFCRRLISLRNYLLRLMSAQLLILWQHLRRVMSLRNYCYAWCLRNWCLWQHQHLSTLLQGKYRVIAETCQMTMNYVLFCDERGYSQQRRITISMIKADLIETEKHGRLLKVLGNCAFHFSGTWIVCSSSLRAPMMFLFRWAKWTAVSQLITPVQAFQFDNSSFLYASFSTLNWAQCCTTFLLKKWLSTGQRQTEVPFA